MTKKKRWALFLCAAMCVSCLCGCGETAEENKDAVKESVEEGQEAGAADPEQEAVQEEQTEDEAGEEGPLPGDFPVSFLFSSGAGAWGTGLVIAQDGSFTGDYGDSNMGETGDDYPKGTAYTCSFSGQFEDIEKVNDYTYRMTLGDVTLETGREEPWIEDGIRFVPADPYGLEDGETFYLYLPQTPLEELEETFLNWWPQRAQAQEQTTLGCYGLYNEKMGYGFFSD